MIDAQFHLLAWLVFAGYNVIGIIFITQLRKEKHMGQLIDAITALTEAVQAETTQVESAIAYINGVPALVAKAVEDALATAGTDATEALKIVADTKASVEAETTSVIAALNNAGGAATTAG